MAERSVIQEVALSPWRLFWFLNADWKRLATSEAPVGTSFVDTLLTDHLDDETTRSPNHRLNVAMRRSILWTLVILRSVRTLIAAQDRDQTNQLDLTFASSADDDGAVVLGERPGGDIFKRRLYDCQDDCRAVKRYTIDRCKRKKKRGQQRQTCLIGAVVKNYNCVDRCLVRQDGDIDCELCLEAYKFPCYRRCKRFRKLLTSLKCKRDCNLARRDKIEFCLLPPCSPP